MHATVRSVIEMASERQEDVCILDTEASPEHLSRGTAQYADVMLVVVEPYFKSLETGRRMAALAKDLGLGRVALIANKMRDERDLEAVQEFAARNELEVGGIIPHDDSMQKAERAGKSPFDFAPDTPAVLAIEDVARRFVEVETGSNGASGNGRP
jgi:CO dehydrogenase maturation factor